MNQLQELNILIKLVIFIHQTKQKQTTSTTNKKQDNKND